jgi:tetratricopeptide (TPR) repeat protein
MDDINQRFSDLGQRDQRGEEAKTLEERDGEIEELIGLYTVLKALSQRGQLDIVKRMYDSISRSLDAQPELRLLFPLLESPLINAYAGEGKVGEAIQLYGEQLENLAERCKDKELQKELQEVSLALSESNDVWTAFEESEKVAEKHMDKDFQQTLLEAIAAICYSVIIGDHWRRLYEEEKFGEGLGEEEPERRLGKDVRSTALIYAYGTMKPDKAFPLFQASYRKLAEIYQDKELQQSCLAFSEVNDVWKRHTEVIKLAEKYRNKEARQYFLFVISFCCSEAILDYSKIGQVDEARALYESLKHFVETHGEERKDGRLVLAQAKGAGNLIYTFVTANRPDEARSIYEDLRKLAEKTPRAARLRVWQANRASDVLYAYATANRPDEARSIYEDLRKLAEDHPNEPRLRVWQAEGAVDLVYAYSTTGRYVEGKKIFQELEELRRDDNVEREIGKKKINGVPVMDWLSQLLQKESAS